MLLRQCSLLRPPNWSMEKQRLRKPTFSAMKMFGSKPVPKHILPSSSIPRSAAAEETDSTPSTEMGISELKTGIPAFKLFNETGLCDSSGAARRLISQGGAYINGERVQAFDQTVSDNDIRDLEILLRAGKKKYHKILIKD